jgi:hypothetical protein
MDAQGSTGAQESAPLDYQIRVRGVLDARWADWFDGLVITHEANGEMTLSGPLADQAALYGLLSKVRDLGLELLAVSRRPSVAGNESGTPPGG